MLQRLSGWARLTGGVIFVGGEVVRQVGGLRTLFLQLAYVSLSILGLAIFMAGGRGGRCRDRPDDAPSIC